MRNSNVQYLLVPIIYSFQAKNKYAIAHTYMYKSSAVVKHAQYPLHGNCPVAYSRNGSATSGYSIC